MPGALAFGRSVHFVGEGRKFFAVLAGHASACAATRPAVARRVIVLEPDSNERPTPEECVRTCGRLARLGEQVACSSARFRQEEEEALDRYFGIVCILTSPGGAPP